MSYTRTSTFPYLHRECLSMFKSFNSLKVNLCLWNTWKDPGKAGQSMRLCRALHWKFLFFTHLRRHVKLKQIDACPYQDYQYQSNVYSNSNAHKSKQHQNEKTLKPEIVSENRCTFCTCC